jgi:hypothetical protein
VTSASGVGCAKTRWKRLDASRFGGLAASRRQIGTVLLAEAAICLRARGHRLWQRHRDISLLACQNPSRIEFSKNQDFDFQPRSLVRG